MRSPVRYQSYSTWTCLDWSVIYNGSTDQTFPRVTLGPARSGREGHGDSTEYRVHPAQRVPDSVVSFSKGHNR